jgi:DNA-binding NarL/FixJ family response regulator
MTKILIVEDEFNIIDSLLELLSYENYEVITAVNGLEGITAARDNLPDLIICDVMMPEMDGYEVLRWLRQDSVTASIPFIFLTAKASKLDVRYGMDIGADDYLTKPYSNEELLAAVRARLEKHAVLEAQRMRDFAHHLVRLQERERRQLSHELEDDVQRLITGLRFTLSALNGQTAPEIYQPLLEAARSTANTVSDHVARIAFSLWPVMIDQLGIVPALLALFEQFEGRTRSAIAFRHAGLNVEISSDITTAVFRIVQEMLNHAPSATEGHTIAVQLWMEDGWINLSIQDENGLLNFATDRLGQYTDDSVLGIYERAIAVNGELMLTTSPEVGLNLTARLPLTAEVAAAEAPASLPKPPPAAPPSATPEVPAPKGAQRASGVINVAFAVDHSLVLQGLKAVLSNQTGIKTVAEAVTRAGLLTMLEDLHPDVVITDLISGGVSNLDIIQTIRQINSSVRILVISSQTNAFYVAEAIRRGAIGYLLTDAGAEEIAQAVQDAYHNVQHISSGIPRDQLDTYLGLDNNLDPALNAYSTLTAREREILQLVAEGRTNASIGVRLSISTRTVEAHRANIIRKLGIRNHMDLVRYALKNGLISIDDSAQ